jgi:hypothetical protein
MTRTSILLKVAANQCQWDEDVQFLVLSGFICRSYPDSDPERFTDATMTFCRDSGIPTELMVKVLCQIADTVAPESPDGVVSSFSEYVSGVVHLYTRERSDRPPESPRL